MNPWYSLAGKTIWVTGGAGYLGTPITAALDAECAKVVCFDLAGKAEALVAEKKLTRTVPVTLDVNDAAGLPAAIETQVARHGVPDGVVHLAFASSSGKRLEQLAAEEFQRTFDHALTPIFVLCRTLAEKMKARGSGSIVLFGSMYGLVAPDPRIYHAPMAPNPIDYGASKAAVLQMARYLAVHYGPAGVRFNCVCPGYIDTPALKARTEQSLGRIDASVSRATPLARTGTVKECASAILYAASEDAGYMTGSTLVADGGCHAQASFGAAAIA